MTAADAVRFWSKVQFLTGNACWEWQGADRGTGYGIFSLGGRSLLAHRVAWELTHGPIPPGLLVCHHCDNPRCVRPGHLFLGTYTDNRKDAQQKGRLVSGDDHWARRHPEKIKRGAAHWSHHKPERLARGERNIAHRHPEIRQGERNGRAKLTAEDVCFVRSSYAAGGVRQVDLARQFGVTQAQISSIVRGESWPEPIKEA